MALRKTSTYTAPHTGNPELDAALLDVARAFNALEDDAVLATSQVNKVAIGTSDTKVYHGLGRPIRGRIIVAQNVAASVADGADSGAPNSYVNLKASSPVTCSVLFY